MSEQWVDSFDDLNKIDVIPDYEPENSRLPPRDIANSVETAWGSKYGKPDPPNKTTFGGNKKGTTFLQGLSKKNIDNDNREEIIMNKNINPFHAYQHRKKIQHAVGSYRRDYMAQKIEERSAHPAAQYALERHQQEQQRQKEMKNIEKPKPSTRPAKPMSSQAALVPYQIQPDEGGRPDKEIKFDETPEMTNEHCGVCDVYFCGEIPARQHYDGQKHAKKMKNLDVNTVNQLTNFIILYSEMLKRLK